MSLNSYYQNELMALRQLGRRFSERNPALAPFLGQAGRDPDVERLLEGFAFLTGRLRQKLDDDLPELTHSLMQLLWPNYMRPLPSVSMLQFEPLDRAGPGLTVERDTPVESGPVAGLVCRFRTCFATEVLPLRLARLDCSAYGEGVLLKLRLDMSAEGSLGDLGLRRIRLHLTGDRGVSHALYLGLMRKLVSIRLSPLDASGRSWVDSHGHPVEFSVPVEQVRPVGFAEDEALIPYPLNTFRGYRYLQEYFFFPEKFLFVDIPGLDVFGSMSTEDLKSVRSFELSFDIGSSDLQNLRPSIDNVKLYCTPVVNLFKQDALPILADARQDEYLLCPSHEALGSCGVYSVDKVTGWQPGGLGYQHYVAFESFEHDPAFDVKSGCSYYSVRHKASLQHEGLDTYLSFGQQGAQPHETVSVELTCTNHNIPLQLRVGDIRHSCDGTPDFVTFRNITTPTASYAPPVGRDFFWRVISNMSLNYLSLANVEALKVILETYDLPRHHDQQAERVSQQLMDALKSISHESVDRLYKGLPLRGVKTELVIDPGGYVGEGPLFLFASVINEFFALYASLNSFHELQVTSTQGGTYRWAPRMGLQPLL